VEGENGAPVVLTSLLDDVYGGDTNNDGNASTPAPGNWGGIWFLSGSQGQLNYLVARYGGHYWQYSSYGCTDLFGSEFVNLSAVSLAASEYRGNMLVTRRPDHDTSPANRRKQVSARP
jgi:hypothetical protein